MMVLAQTPDDRLAQLQSNLKRFRRRVLRGPFAERPETLIVCGYGPSLARTWEEIPKVPGALVMTTSGAHDFLISRGIIPAFHVECEPRSHKAKMMAAPHPAVQYYIASHSHPTMFEKLACSKVTMWHGYTDDDVVRQVATIKRFDPKAILLSGGTNVGMRAIVVGRHLGFARFILHGMDCCYEGDTLWAGPHTGSRHHTVRIRSNKREFVTSDTMMQSSDDFFNQARELGNCAFTVLGDGLLAARCELYKRDPALALSPEWWEPVDFDRNRFSRHLAYPERAAQAVAAP